MAMTVRLPEELDRKLEELARQRHTSKHALIVEGAAMIVDLETKTDLDVQNATGERSRYSELLRRLEYA